MRKQSMCSHMLLHIRYTCMTTYVEAFITHAGQDTAYGGQLLPGEISEVAQQKERRSRLKFQPAPPPLGMVSISRRGIGR